MSELKEGSIAPDFSLPSSDGTEFRLSDFKGEKNIILYFYPKDNTPGCSKEASDFRDQIRKFRSADAEIFGVSFDSLDSHQKFSGKYKLPFQLLSDVDKAVARKYGVFKKKNMYGRSFMGIERATFVIGKDQKIKKIFRKVKVEGHSAEVLSVLAEI